MYLFKLEFSSNSHSGVGLLDHMDIFLLFSEAPPYCFPQSTSFYFNRLFKGPLSRSSHLLRFWGLGLQYMSSGGWGHKSVHNRIQSLTGRGRGQNFVPNFSPKRSQEKSWSQHAHEVHFMKFNCVMLRINIAERIQVIVFFKKKKKQSILAGLTQ